MASLLHKNPPEPRDPEKGSPDSSRILLIIRWILAAFFFSGILVFFPSVSSVLLLLLTVLTVPIKPLEQFLHNKIHLKKGIKIAAMAVVFVVSVAIAPNLETTPAENAEQPPTIQTNPDSKGQTSDDKTPAQTPPKDTPTVETPDTPTQTDSVTDATPASDTQASSPSVSGDTSAAEPTPTPAPTPEPDHEPEPEAEPTLAPEPEIPHKENYHGHVYATPSGKRYHYEENCANGKKKNSVEITWDDVTRRGLTPCQTCVAK